jgi:hypothetical protein
MWVLVRHLNGIANDGFGQAIAWRSRCDSLAFGWTPKRRTENDELKPSPQLRLNIQVSSDSRSDNVRAEEDLMEDTKAEPSPVKEPVQVIQLSDGYIEIFSETRIAFGSGKSPWLIKGS